VRVLQELQDSQITQTNLARYKFIRRRNDRRNNKKIRGITAIL